MCLQVTIVAESFGGCLGLRVAAAAPELVERLVLVNPATSFVRALGGLPGAIASTNLLSLFPEPLYQVGSPLAVHHGGLAWHYSGFMYAGTNITGIFY